jgi:hypothetical protein
MGHRIDWINASNSIVDFCVFVVPQKSKTAAIADSVHRNQSKMYRTKTQFDDGAAAEEAPWHQSHMEDQDGQPPSLPATQR